MSEPSTLSHGFTLGQYHVRPRQEQIQGPEQTYHLEPKVMQVLVTLAEHAQRPVSRDQLLETVWAGTVVGDEVVSRAISLLRGYLQDERKNPRFIRTIPKTGYELIQPVFPLEPEVPQGRTLGQSGQPSLAAPEILIDPILILDRAIELGVVDPGPRDTAQIPLADGLPGKAHGSRQRLDHHFV